LLTLRRKNSCELYNTSDSLFPQVYLLSPRTNPYISSTNMHTTCLYSSSSCAPKICQHPSTTTTNITQPPDHFHPELDWIFSAVRTYLREERDEGRKKVRVTHWSQVQSLFNLSTASEQPCFCLAPSSSFSSSVSSSALPFQHFSPAKQAGLAAISSHNKTNH
jgi:hypothetical protein